MKHLNSFLLFIVFVSIFACSEVKKKTTTAETLFTLVPNVKTGIDFKNTIIQDLKFNALTNAYAYNGGGVAVGDVNNDGFQDIYFVSNQHSNKLYINKEDFEFEDVTKQAGIIDEGGWSNGVTMIDINNDGWLDIYVCKSATSPEERLHTNKLFINQKNETFKEEAEKWGLDHKGFSTQSYFFDFDRDGDLDMYLLSNRYDFKTGSTIEDRSKRKFFSETSDHLFRNDGESFTDITLKSGIRNKEFGLSASIGDFNNDGWPDIYVANDYITPDFLYINNKNGTFTNQINDRFNHTSYTSMGSDYADINNDFLPDLLVLDMSAEDHRRDKQNMPIMNTIYFWKMLRNGYPYSYLSNTLNLNYGNGHFIDIAQVSGISKTDWSWAPLIADFDCDGYKDIFITNGLEHELGNQDYRDILRIKQISVKTFTVDDILSTMPSEKLMNYAYKNNGDLTFTKVMKAWGLDRKVNSQGVAYADFDNDGDLDLVLNNLEEEALIYQNNSTGNYINIKLVGDNKNINAIGARVKVYTDKTQQYQELYTSRGFLSSVTNILNFGLGDQEKINRIEVIWGDNSVLAMDSVEANQTLTFNKKDFNFDVEIKTKSTQNFVSVTPMSLGIEYTHLENDFNDFELQVLLPQKQSQKGPALSVADVNGDGLDDFFVGGAFDQPGEMYIQGKNGSFANSSPVIFEKDKKYEDNNALFFDADTDGDLDLFVASGGYELKENSSLLQDRLYLNNGSGEFVKSTGLPKMFGVTKGVSVGDYDNDGSMDLVVGGHVVPGKYPLSSRSYILKNTKGRFEDVTQKAAPELYDIGIVNDLIFSDYDNDGDKDLIVVGEWFPITIFANENSVFSKADIQSLDGTEGWWNTIQEIDLDMDGNMDYLVGNLGKNNKFHPSQKKPLHIFSTSFDDDGNYDMVLSMPYKGNLVPIRGKESSTEQNPFVSEKISSYKEFANSSLMDIYGKEELETAYHKKVHMFSSVYLKNMGNGTFEIIELPISAQLGPTMEFVIADVNYDGSMDILGMGGIHEAEAGTVRYDANTGYVLLGDGMGNFQPFKDHSFFTRQNTKAIKSIWIDDKNCFLVANNNGPLEVFALK